MYYVYIHVQKWKFNLIGSFKRFLFISQYLYFEIKREAAVFFSWRGVTPFFADDEKPDRRTRRDITDSGEAVLLCYQM